MKRNIGIIFISILILFFSAGVLYADTAPNKFADTVAIQESSASQIVATFTLPAWPKQETIKGDDGIDYMLYEYGKDYIFQEQEGKPRLPERDFWLQIPEDAKNINVEVLEGQSEIKENVVVYPAPHRYFEPGPNGVVIEKEQFAKDTDFYSQDAWYPAKPVEIKEIAFLRQLRMVNIAIYPTIYNPLKRQIKQFGSLKIKITYASKEAKNQIPVDTNDPSHKIYQNILPNYSYVAMQVNNNQSWTVLDDVKGVIRILSQQYIIDPNPGNPIDYLIVCADAFCNTTGYLNFVSPSIMSLANHRANHPYDIGIVSVSNIYAQYPAASHEESIKNFIQFAYDHWRYIPQIPDLDFILLVGDADYGQSSQNWFLPVWRTNNTLWGDTSDNDYACVSGSDSIPDLMMGRLSAKTETELSNMVSRTIYFETHPLLGQNHWGSRNLFLQGYNTLEQSLFNFSRNILINNYQEIQEWNAFDPPYGYSSGDVTDYLNSEGALLVTYNGHGDYSGVGWWPGVDVVDLANADKTPACVFSFCCLTGAFDYTSDNCYGEKWLKLPFSQGGSVSFFGSSRVSSGVWSVDQIILPIIYSDDNFLLGSVILQAKPSFSSPYRKQYNLLGDPALNFSNHIGICNKPEININSLTFSNLLPLPGEEVTINIEVKNLGLSPAQNVIVQLFEKIGNDLIQIGPDQLISNLQSGETVLLQQQWTCTLGNTHTFLVKTDPQNTIDELSDYNDHNPGIYFVFSSIPTLYVDASNMTGIENGSLQHPFNTISEAFAYIEANRTDNTLISVNVMEGTYDEPGIITLNMPHHTYLKGIGTRENTVIKDGVNAGILTTIENLTFDLDYQNHNYVESGVLINNIFKHCIIGIITPQYGIPLRNNIFYGNLTAVQYNCYNPFNYDFLMIHTNNIFCENDKAIKIVAQNANTTLFLNLWNNIFLNNLTVVDLVGQYNTESSLYFTNDIIIGNAQCLVGPPNINLSAYYNNSDDPDILNSGLNNINAEPLFVNPFIHNYHLMPNSPCIDAGNTSNQFFDPEDPNNPGMALYPAMGTISNDMGAYGGPDVFIPEQQIGIISPQEGQTIMAAQGMLVIWDAPGIAPNESLTLKISHVVGGPSTPDKIQGLSTPNQQSSLWSNYQRFVSNIVDFFDIKPAYGAVGTKVPFSGTVVDLMVAVQNTGSYLVPAGILGPNTNYTLTIYKTANSTLSDTVHFKTSFFNP